MNGKVDRPEALTFEPGHLEADLARTTVRVTVRECELERPPDHQGDEPVLRHLGGLECPLVHSVAQDGDPVGDRRAPPGAGG